MKIWFMMIVCALAWAGCTPVDSGEKSKDSTSPGLGDSVTQKTTIDAGRKVADKLDAIGVQHRAEFDEVIQD